MQKQSMYQSLKWTQARKMMGPQKALGQNVVKRANKKDLLQQLLSYLL